MTRTLRAPPADRALRDAFEAVEVQPTPAALKDHVDRLTGQPPKPGRPH